MKVLIVTLFNFSDNLAIAVQPSMRNAKLGKHTPQNMGSFVAPSATVVGNVSIGEHSSVWYNAVLRGKDGRI